MPLVDGKYVSPTWVNGGPPAIDAQELQVTTDRLADTYTTGETYPQSKLYTQAQCLSDATKTLLGLTTSAVPDDALVKLNSSAPKIAYGSYVGAGTYGASNPNALTFDFYPKFVIVSESNSSVSSDNIQIIAIKGQSGFCANNMGDASWYNYISWSGKSISWYTNATGTRAHTYQLNTGGSTYYYFAIG